MQFSFDQYQMFRSEYWPITYTSENRYYNPAKQAPGPRLNIKTVLSTYGDFHVKDKTAVMTSYL